MNIYFRMLWRNQEYKSFRNFCILFWLLIGLLFAAPVAAADGSHFYVAVDGSDAQDGTSPDAPLATWQQALFLAQPGDVIHIAAGDYYQDVLSIRDGLPDAPITIMGPLNAVLHGGGNGRIFQINHNYLTLQGFTIDGLHANPDEEAGYRDKLLYVQGQQIQQGVIGLKVLHMTFKNAGGECLRLRYFVQAAEIGYSAFINCGVVDFRFNGGGKNGEAIYVGTSSNQWADGKNLTAEPDISRDNWIHHNFMDTHAECVEIKEGAEHNLIEYNSCTGQQDENSAGLVARGDGNIFRHNHVFGNVGAGIMLGGHRVDGVQYGKRNAVYENWLHENESGGIYVRVLPQGNMCDNRFSENGAGNLVREADLPAILMVCADEGRIPPVRETAVSPSLTSQTALAVTAVSASGHDGHLPNNTLDGDLATRWSAQGAGEWIQYDLGSPQPLQQVDIAFYEGAQRVAWFDVLVSGNGRDWTRLASLRSSGLTDDFQTFTFPATSARYVRLVNYLNSYNDWNSLTEVVFYDGVTG